MEYNKSLMGDCGEVWGKPRVSVDNFAFLKVNLE